MSITEEIRENLHKSMKVCSVIQDLAEAFDTVKHDILIHNVKPYGLRGQALKFNQSYLSERNQFSEFGKKFQVLSNSRWFTALAPLLFLV